MRKGGQDDYDVAEFPKFASIGWGYVRAELKCDQEPSILDVANVLIKLCQSTVSDCDWFEREFGAWITSEFDHSGTASGISRSRLKEIQDRSWIGSRVDGLDGTTLCMGCKQCSSEGNRENALSFVSGVRTTLEKLWQLVTCVWGRSHSEDGARLNMRRMRGVFVGKLDHTDEFLRQKVQ